MDTARFTIYFLFGKLPNCKVKVAAVEKLQKQYIYSKSLFEYWK